MSKKKNKKDVANRLISLLLGFLILFSFSYSAQAQALDRNAPDPSNHQSLITDLRYELDKVHPSLIDNQPKQAILNRPLCGNTSILTLLLIGNDYRGEDYLYGLADSIRIVRIDFTSHKVSVLTLERAIWVEIPGISDHFGITHHILNMAYFYGVPAMGFYDGPNGGAGLLAETLEKNFGLKIDNYIVVGMEAFSNSIDILGGVDVFLPHEVFGDYGEPGQVEYQRLGYFPAGLNLLEGQRALDLARIRSGYSTIFRNKNQDRIFNAIFHKITSPSIILKAPELLNLVKDTVLTDLSLKQVGSMICLITKMNNSDLTFTAIPDENYTERWFSDPAISHYVDGFEVDYDFFREYISDFMAGELP